MTNDKNKSVADELEEVEAHITALEPYRRISGRAVIALSKLDEQAAELRGKYQLLGW